MLDSHIQSNMGSQDSADDGFSAARSAGSTLARFAFDNTYARLPERFFARLKLQPLAAPRLIKLNVELARLLGLDPDALASEHGAEILSGGRVATGSEPLAMAYAGHQFGHFVPQLGDGRTNLLGEVLALDGQRYDIQLKGSGPTPFSRRGDGLAALGPVLREYIVSEAMAALGIPTTRALAAVTTGVSVVRETVVPGAILTRVAASHLRVGTFQYFAARGDVEGTRTLADYAIARHYPEAARSTQPYLALLEGVIARQASLIARWMLVGFVHGVMNTDNTSISGETIDFGPCAFMEAYDPATVFSSIDHQGRYAYGNQPTIALWNLTRLAETLLPLIEQATGNADKALGLVREALSSFQPQFEAARNLGFYRKLGLLEARTGDLQLVEDLLERMSTHHADFTLTFRRLCDAAANREADANVGRLFDDPDAYLQWAARWHSRLAQESASPLHRARAMRIVNPAYIPRNHRVALALEAAVDHGNLQPFEDLLEVLAHPWVERPALEDYATPATPSEYVHATFCGT